MSKTVKLDELMALKVKLVQQELSTMQLAMQLKQQDLQKLGEQILAEYEEGGRFKIVSVDWNKLEVARELIVPEALPTTTDE